jgi:hypothetical protein
MGKTVKSQALTSSRDVVMPLAAQTHTPAVEDLIARYNSAVRPSLRRLVSSPRMADVARVFPAIAYALAARRGPATQRRKALNLIEAGTEIKEVSRTLNLPMWLRRLPPEAFDTADMAYPRSEIFSRRIANHLPANASESATWLRSVAFGSKACNDFFAIWFAQQNVFHSNADEEKLLAALTAYAWFSTAEDTRAYALIVLPWRPEMAFDTAVCAAKCWLNRVRLTLQLREGTLTDPWLQQGEAMGLTFSPLLDCNDILAEAHAMQNCADQYADRLARDKCRLFSVRRRGQRVATLEIGPHVRETGVLSVTQLKARQNMPAALEVWQAAHAWLSQQPQLRRTPPMAVPERPLDTALWQSMMQPYRLAQRGAPWLPEVATASTFSALDQGIADLARRGGVSSWLFT